MRFSTNFNYLSIDEYVKTTIDQDSNLNTQELVKSLEQFKARKLKGELCDCGNEIWIVGSAISGKGCFSCITGETDSSGDYEVE